MPAPPPPNQCWCNSWRRCSRSSFSTKVGCSPSATLAHGQRWRRRRRLAATAKSAAPRACAHTARASGSQTDSIFLSQATVARLEALILSSDMASGYAHDASFSISVVTYRCLRPKDSGPVAAAPRSNLNTSTVHTPRRSNAAQHQHYNASDNASQSFTERSCPAFSRDLTSTKSVHFVLTTIILGRRDLGGTRPRILSWLARPSIISWLAPPREMHVFVGTLQAFLGVAVIDRPSSSL